MKTILLVFFLLTSLMTAAAPPHIPLAWDANSESDLAGYRVHYGTESGNYTASIDIPGTPAAPTFLLEDLTAGQTYFIAVTAYNVYGLESEYSDELEVEIPEAPAPPGNLREAFELDLQTSHDLRHWQHVASLTHHVAEPRQFWRIEFSRP